jgi:hypothetical protein
MGKPTLADTMSQYLIERITSASNIEVRYRSEVVAGSGNGHLERLTLADRDSGAKVRNLYLGLNDGAARNFHANPGYSRIVASIVRRRVLSQLACGSGGHPISCEARINHRNRGHPAPPRLELPVWLPETRPGA